MKYFLCVLIAAFSLLSSIEALPSPLGESLIEYQTIISSPLLQSTLLPDEMVVDVVRLTKDIAASTIYYEIRTRIPQIESVDYEIAKGKKPPHIHLSNRYKLKMDSSLNPFIGPRVLTVISIKPLSHHTEVLVDIE